MFLFFCVARCADQDTDDIPANTKSYTFSESVKRITDYAFKNSADSLISLNFSQCTHLGTIGKSAFENCTNLKEIDLRNCIELVRIGDRAFYNCSSLVTFIFPPDISVRIIGSCCFAFTNIQNLTIPSSIVLLQSNQEDYGLFGSSSIKQITFSEKATLNQINPKTFSHSSITSITLPASVQTISPLAFAHCHLLKKVNFTESQNPNFEIYQDCVYSSNFEEFIFVPAAKTGNLTVHKSTKTITSYAFSFSKINPIILSDTVEKIESYAFYKSSIKSIVLKDWITDIDEYAFSDCQNLTEISFPFSLISIPTGILMNCTSLVSVKLGKIEKIGSHAFYNCTSLSSISSINTVSEIENSAFAMTNLKHFIVPASLSQWNNILWGSKTQTITVAQGNTNFVVENGILLSAFLDVIYFAPYNYSTAIQLHEGITEIADYTFAYNLMKFITLPKSLTHIGSHAFYKCQNLLRIDIPKKVKVINTQAFKGCSKLKYVTFSDQIEEIYEESFAYCNSVKHLSFPKSLRLIKANAFKHCKKLSVIEILGNPDIYSSAFRQCNSISCVIWETATKNKAEDAGFIWDTLNSCNIAEIKANLYQKPVLSDALVECDVAEINPEMFARSKEKLSTLSFEVGSQLSKICDYSFKGFKSLKLADLRNCGVLIEIGEGAFMNCEQLSTLLFPTNSQVKILGPSSFAYTALDKVYIMNSIATLAGNISVPGVFEGCSKLTLVEISLLDSSLKEFSSRLFANTPITKINIPASVKHIEGSAFLGCEKLSKFDIENGNRNFQMINGSLYQKSDGKFIIVYASKVFVEEFVMMDTITDISSAAFSLCGFYKIKPSNALRTIGDFAFSHCHNLTEFYMPPSTLSFGDACFENCWNLTTVNLTYAIPNIPRMAFYHCFNLTKIVLHDACTFIGKKAFYGCLSLKLCWGCHSIVEIQNYAFTYTAIESFHVCKYLSRIGKEVFRNCVFLKYFQIDIENTYFTYYCDALYTYDYKTLIHADLTNHRILVIKKGCETLEDFACCAAEIYEVVIPGTVTEISNSCFANCTNLMRVQMENSVKTIGNYAFFNCSSLKSAKFPSGIEVFGVRCFANCMRLKSVVIADGAKIIGAEAFRMCVKLASLYISNTVEFIGKNAFANTALECSVDRPVNLIEQITEAGLDRSVLKKCQEL